MRNKGFALCDGERISPRKGQQRVRSHHRHLWSGILHIFQYHCGCISHNTLPWKVVLSSEQKVNIVKMVKEATTTQMKFMYWKNVFTQMKEKTPKQFLSTSCYLVNERIYALGFLFRMGYEGLWLGTLRVSLILKALKKAKPPKRQLLWLNVVIITSHLCTSEEALTH